MVGAHTSFTDTRHRLIVIPLSFLRRLDSLKYTSVIALISIAYLVVLVVYHFAKGDTLDQRGAVNVINWQGVVPTLASFPVIVFAYTCHQNVRDENGSSVKVIEADSVLDVLHPERNCG